MGTPFMRGRHTTTLQSIHLSIGYQGLVLEHNTIFFIDCEYEYEAPIKATEDEPGCEEYFEIWNVRPIHPVILYYDGSVKITLDNCKLEDILRDSELEMISNKVLKELKEESL